MSDMVDALTISLVWLDDSDENTAIQQQLRLIDKNLHIYKAISECEEYIKSQPEDACITLVVNGRFGEQLVPNIHELPQVNTIYVYCWNKQLHEKWAKNYTKVKDVCNEFNVLQKQLQPHHLNKNKSIVTELPTTTTTEPEPTPFQNMYDVNLSYMISDACFDYLTRMKMNPAEKDDFISLCQNGFQGNDEFLAILREFQESYSADQAIWWLHRHPFFSICLNYIFTFLQIDPIFHSRVFIHDICKQLEQNKCTSTMEVYRCEPMSNEQFEQLKKFNGKIIAMKSFFLTNSNRETIISYIPKCTSIDKPKCILFTIEANSQIPNVKSFTKVGPLSNNNDPNDVVFMIGSLFKITEIEDEKDGVINIKMTLCANDGDNTIKSTIDHVKCQYIDTNGETDVIGFGQFLVTIGNSLRDMPIFDAGEKLIRYYLDKLPNDHLDRVRCYDVLGYIDSLKNNLDSSLNWYKKSFEIKKEKLPATDPNLAESYNNMASLCLQKQDFTQALEYSKQLLIILKQLYGGDDHIGLIGCYDGMATIYEHENKLAEAFSCYSQVEIILIKHGATNNKEFATLCNNLGMIRTELKHYHIALGYYKTSLELKLSLLTPVDPSIATTYRNIGITYRNMGNVQQSRENLEKAAEIYRQIQSSDNPNIIEIEKLLQNSSE